MRRLACLAATAWLAAGCTSLLQTYVGESEYLAFSCPELHNAWAHVQREVGQLSRERSRHVGVLLPSRAAVRNAERLSAYQGRLAAIERAQRANGCLRPA